MWLALLPLIAAQSELCPEVTTSKPCSASQDFVFVVDASFSRLEYHGEFQEFLRRFAGGLDLGDSDGPRMSIVSFDGTTAGLPAADVTTIHVSLSSSEASLVRIAMGGFHGMRTVSVRMLLFAQFLFGALESRCCSLS